MKVHRTAAHKASKESRLDYMKRFMSGLHADQGRLREIQAVYDNLTLLGQLLCAGTDITAMRNDFNTLADELLTQLACELRKKAVLNLASSAQVSIDMLVRNLYERTADIGFLATDTEIRRFAEAVEKDSSLVDDPAHVLAIQARFGEYVRKYSVYHNIILLAPDGRVLSQLDANSAVRYSADPLIGESLTTHAPYVETFRTTDLLPGEHAPLIYSYRVMSADNSHPVGILCLCFRFEDECRRVFENLVDEDDWTVVTILDQEGKIIASSNVYELPEGAKVERVLDEESRIVRFAGREYLATTHQSSGYQGYAGPGWLGHAMSPLNHAFEMAVAHELARVSAELLDGVLQTATLFSPSLREIPKKAGSIQSELNRAVWNGNIWLTREHAAINTSFAKVLLWEIGSTGVKTRNVFSESTRNLYETVVSSVLFGCGNQAALAIDIMDRNLYERANDCRWWALTPTFRQVLKGEMGQDPLVRRQALTDVLRTINGLYTVYSNLLVFDAHGRIVAVSNPSYADMIGQPVAADWVRPTLGLQDTQRYMVSDFVATPLYDHVPTYVYAAPILNNQGGDPLGGIAIVFDSTPQFQAMLHDTLPRDEDGEPVVGALAVFAAPDGRVISSTDASLKAGDRIELPKAFFDLMHGERFTDIVVWRGRYYAVGSCMSAGYREYKGAGDAYTNDVVALVLSPLSDRVAQPSDLLALQEISSTQYSKRQSTGEDAIELATFYIGEGWYGIPSNCVLEAFEASNISAVPGVPSWVRGCIVHQGQTVAVVDLRGFLTGEEPNRQGQLVIMVKVPGQSNVYGILVDELGEIPQIPRSRIDPATGMLASNNTITESLVRPFESDPDKRILIVLSVERMVAKLTGAGEPAEAEVLNLMSSLRTDRRPLGTEMGRLMPERYAVA